jgi:tetratricopeptide (TPR) repeat protein
MGEVFTAYDRVLNRTVAVKVVKRRYANSPAVTKAFLDEARITGQLQHPGIPPVHDLGNLPGEPPAPGLVNLPDGRPFLVMKLIKGRTLAELLKERPDPAHDRPRFLHVFEQICQAVGYAHERMVIHRDLKPLNVMVGPFGEVQVMDWGLAKVLTDAPAPDGVVTPPDGSLTRIEAGGERDATHVGVLKGTPAYMPPEQARGEIDCIDRRSDVFALGAILCVVLTGQPPYTGDSPAELELAERMRLRDREVIQFAARLGLLDGAFARLGGCGADPELIDLCRRCLAPNAADRLPDAKAVADAVAAYREAVEARAERDRLARNEAAVELLLGQCEDALRANDAAKATLVLEQAESRAADGGAEHSGGRFARCRRELEMLKELDRIDDLRWTLVGGELPDRTTLSDSWSESFRRFGIDVGRTSADTARGQVAGAWIQDRVLASLDAWFVSSPSDDLLALLRAADADPFRDEARAAMRAGDARRLRELCDTPDALRQPVRFAIVLGERHDVPFAHRERILLAAHHRQPDNFLVVMALGNLYPIGQPKHTQERVGWYRTALGLRPANPIVWLNLGAALNGSGDVDNAILAYEEAVRLDPSSALAHNNLGNAMLAKGDPGRAIAHYRTALSLDPACALAHYNLGLALLNHGDAGGAVAACGEAIRLNPRDKLAPLALGHALKAVGNLDGAVAAYRQALGLDPNFVKAHFSLASVLKVRGDRAGALAAYREAVRRDPTNAAAHNHLGNALQEAGDRDGAIAAYEQATTLDPENPRYAINLALARKAAAQAGPKGPPTTPLSDGPP